MWRIVLSTTRSRFSPTAFHCSMCNGALVCIPGRKYPEKCIVLGSAFAFDGCLVDLPKPEMDIGQGWGGQVVGLRRSQFSEKKGTSKLAKW